MTCFNELFYAYEYPKNDVASKIQISEDDLNRATDVLLGYIKGDIDTLEVEVSVAGEKVDMFNAKEMEHMKDVKELYQTISILRWISLAGLILIIALRYITKVKDNFRSLFSAYRHFLIIVFSFIGAIAVFALADFNSFWHMFHHIFFTNDLWLLDPNRDRLIMMVPSGFFYDLILLIIFVFLAATFLIYVLLRMISKREGIREC